MWGARADRRQLSDSYWRQPLAWNAAALRAGKRARVFCAWMADIFEDRRDLDTRRDQLWQLIEAPQLDWLLLTKRPHKVAELAPYGDRWPANVWLGATAENQKWLDKRMLELERPQGEDPVPVLRTLTRSAQSLRRGTPRHGRRRRQDGRLDHRRRRNGAAIARPMNPQWARSLRDQCLAAGIKFHFKQYGNGARSRRGR